jgi:hypothetical protein
MDAETEAEIFHINWAGVFARIAVDGFQQATQRCDGDWVGETFDACDLVAMAGFFNLPADEEAFDAVCDVIDGWGGPWVRTVPAEDHL